MTSRGLARGRFAEGEPDARRSVETESGCWGLTIPTQLRTWRRSPRSMSSKGQ